MNSSEYGNAAVEVLNILENTNEDDVKKIPQCFIDFLEEIATKEYVVNFDHSKTIAELEISPKAQELMGVIYINWWSDENKKDIYKKQIVDNAVAKEVEIRNRYNSKNIFSKQLKHENIILNKKKEASKNVENSSSRFKQFVFNFFS